MTCCVHSLILSLAGMSDREVFHAADFPSSLPEDTGITAKGYERFKQAFIGAEVPAQWLSKDTLRQAGATSWKQYHMCMLATHWDLE